MKSKIIRGILSLLLITTACNKKINDKIINENYNKICISGNFDGNVKKAESALEKCKDTNAILLMGDYSKRGISGEINYKTDFESTKKVLSIFSNFKENIYILAGSNDNPENIIKISKNYPNFVPLKNNKKEKIMDLDILPLNGYNDLRFMFEGAEYINDKKFNEYLANLINSGKVISTTHISPYGHIDKLPNGKNVGESELEKVLEKNSIDSISSAIRESPGVYKLEKRWKINPGDYTLIVYTDKKGNIKEVK